MSSNTLDKVRAKELKSTVPAMKGFSLTNIKYMVQFAKEYPEFAISQQVVGQIPWGHNILLLQKLETLPDELKGSLPSIEQIEQELETRE